MSLTDTQIDRYSRQIILPQVGGAGQVRLLEARVLVVGADGLGCSAALYLAAAGIGTLGIADGGRVQRSCVSGRILYGAEDIGAGKAATVGAALRRLNPDCVVRVHAEDPPDAALAARVSDYDVVVDACGREPDHVALNQWCVAAGVPLVVGNAEPFEGQISTFTGFRPDAPCYRCAAAPLCGDGLPDEGDGIRGVVAGLVGTLQATEALKLLLGVGAPLIGRWLIYDARTAVFRELAVSKARDCTACAPVDAGPIADEESLPSPKPALLTRLSALCRQL